MIEIIADRLAAARRTAVPIPPIRSEIATLADAYAVQRLNADRRRAAGTPSAGRKIGLTSAAVQRQLGVTAPDSGWLWTDTRFANGAEVPTTNLIAPRVEAEIAFILARDITDPDAPLEPAIAAVVPAIEIVDSAIADWNIVLIDTVADNASAWGFVIGGPHLRLADLDLPNLKMTLARNGHIGSTGLGSATMGNPLTALAWLARHAIDSGEPLRAGEIILAGALGPVLPAAPGDHFEARIEGFAPLSLHFT
ncbi:2-keto-4-pentenoate hydratase [Polymorphobacter glacialis]|uniref:2-keto-4-pentenoate hydratase n=1 Tax=Sandarakinorhabdus glacialis TaxID=1614636 RepID=A0A916ZLM6_9SPHN|nr:fumarylacetoacetate hydrolase family protein [Polymorphobacter glacialis]GGE03674.1 2-keto-4-pentenoate hydratase [Polymorphobacter glacialis]